MKPVHAYRTEDEYKNHMSWVRGRYGDPALSKYYWAAVEHALGWRPILDMPLTTVGCLVDILDRRRIHTGLTVQGISHHGGLVYIYTRFGVLASDDMKWRPHE